MRRKHGSVPKLHTCSGLDSHNEQKRWHSKCRYKRNSGSIPAGMDNLRAGEARGATSSGRITSKRGSPQSAPTGPHSRSRHENENGTVLEHEYRPRGVRRVGRPSGAAGHSHPGRGRNAAPWPGSSSSPSPAWLEDASSAELEDGFHPQMPEEEAGCQPTRR